MKKFIIWFTLYLLAVNIFGEIDYKKIDNMISQAAYMEAYNELLKVKDDSRPDLKILWRMGFVCYQLGEAQKDKKDKITWYEKGENYTKPYIYLNSAEKRDRAEIIQWYAINYASRMKIKGIFGGKESMKSVPYLFELMDKSQSIDPEYAGSYLFKAKLHEDVPFFLKGNKNLMGINYINAVKYALDNEKIVMLTEAAKGFFKRNWDKNKRKEEAKKNNIGENNYYNFTDRQYSYNLLIKAKLIYESKVNQVNTEKMIYQEILELLKKY